MGEILMNVISKKADFLSEPMKIVWFSNGLGGNRPAGGHED